MQKLRIAIITLLSVFSLTSFVYAEQVELLTDTESTYLARVVEVTNSTIKDVPNTETQALYQTVRIVFIKGDKMGKEVVATDTSFPMKVGDKVYVRYVLTRDGTEYFSIQEPYRLPAILWLLALFVVAVLFFGGKQGFLSLLALFISFAGIFKLLFPQIIHGGNIVIIATSGALLSLFIVMYLTHGFTRLTTAAFLGSTSAVLMTLFLAKYAVVLTALTGFASEESVFLNLATKGNLDFVALLIGGIVIGVIGVVDDVAITQASVVNELRHANPLLSKKELYIQAMRVGKNHMGAVINTLILAYTGSSLPIVLLLYVSDTPALELINRELISTEIIRSIVGSIGLLCAVPLTTLIAVFLMQKKEHTTHHTHSHHH